MYKRQEWDGFKFNILDTPGYFDFVGEAREALHVAEAGIIVVSAKAGVQVEMCIRDRSKAESAELTVKENIVTLSFHEIPERGEGFILFKLSLIHIWQPLVQIRPQTEG